MHVALVLKMSVITSTQLSLHMYCIGCGILHKFRISRHVMKTIWIFLLSPDLVSPSTWFMVALLESSVSTLNSRRAVIYRRRENIAKVLSHTCHYCDVCTLPQFVSSDHKPLIVTFNTSGYSPVTQTNIYLTSTPDWSKADDYSLSRYETVLNELLTHVDIPVSLLASDVNASNNQAVQMIDNYYQNVMTCIKTAIQISIHIL